MVYRGKNMAGDTEVSATAHRPIIRIRKRKTVRVSTGRCRNLGFEGWRRMTSDVRRLVGPKGATGRRRRMRGGGARGKGEADADGRGCHATNQLD
jgi:hypothetical protein